MDTRLRVAIAGYGIVGKRRRQFIDRHPRLRTVAVCDRTFEADGQHTDGVWAHRHYMQLLEHDFDILFVCMTNDIAPEVTIAGLDKGVHVFCEKPPGRDLADIAQVIACEQRSPGLKLKYGFNHRYHESVLDALRIVQSEELGKVINIRGVYGKSQFISFGNTDWRVHRELAGGGILLDQGIHMVDLMRLFGGEYNEVHSIVSNEFWQYDVEDNAYALMRSDRGVVAMLHSTATQWRHRFSLDVTMSRGAVGLSGILSGSKSYGAETLTVVWAGDGTGDPREQTTRYNRDPSWESEIVEFVEAIDHDTPITNGCSRDALLTTQLVYRIYCSDRKWRDRWGLSDEIPKVE
ncbi:MAG: Gfo/Idh/MocA family oxidoreductase [Alphaproteobacteria bacterium]|nr:Gfo/Idh/MocA family oxidoreductase [Alphaproteobacteria bacterium]MDE2495227.1 Gfo/Idh/MocA family oxidoreductase [Alphaproteobacteria bacterium]